ncbi:hypothetical protein Nepgr_009922 [Nepenthes gracilis]|uniref:CRIB domain-containing protein n=1 Tax=Nepenthes gracilis TaxID=150966 RepID=A0AAD3XKL1_NEPGR|nr:hypothetical protein Nepgr_009922 [Nepenthes gracilis]
MKDCLERRIILPLSPGRASASSIAGGKSSSAAKMKNYFRSIGLPEINISQGLRQLMRSLKNFSLLFYEIEEDEMEMKMEIGLPTDVKHVTHIGLDGSATTNHVRQWGNLRASEIISLPSISSRQFELVMAAQTDSGHLNCFIPLN